MTPFELVLKLDHTLTDTVCFRWTTVCLKELSAKVNFTINSQNEQKYVLMKYLIIYNNSQIKLNSGKFTNRRLYVLLF